MPSTATRPLFERIDQWLEEVDGVKSAAAKSKPGSSVKKGTAGAGVSTHVSDDVDNMTQDADTGDRYRENTEDVSRDVPGTSVDETDAGSGGDQDSKQYNIGTNQSATGEDPSVETASAKGDKEDSAEGGRGGTSHPANAEEIGEKYSSMKLAELLKLAETKATNILTGITKDVVSPKTASKTAAAQRNSAGSAAQTPAQAAQLGYDTAAALAEMDKAAEDFIAQVICDAEIDADLVGSYLHSYAANRIKAAEGYSEEMEEEENNNDRGEKEEREEGGPPADAGMPPPDMGGMPEGGPPAEGDILSLLGGGGVPAEVPPPAPAGGGGLSEEEAMQLLTQVIEELGAKEELAQAGDQGAKIASAVHDFKRSGRFRYQEAKTAAQRQASAQIKGYIIELLGNKG